MWINFFCSPLSFSLKYVIDYGTESQKEYIDYRIKVQHTIKKLVTNDMDEEVTAYIRKICLLNKTSTNN